MHDTCIILFHRMFQKTLYNLPRPGPCRLKTNKSLVNETFNFQMYCMQKNSGNFCLKNVRSFCSAKAPYNFSAKNITADDFMSNVRFN